MVGVGDQKVIFFFQTKIFELHAVVELTPSSKPESHIDTVYE